MISLWFSVEYFWCSVDMRTYWAALMGARGASSGVLDPSWVNVISRQKTDCECACPLSAALCLRRGYAREITNVVNEKRPNESVCFRNNHSTETFRGRYRNRTSPRVRGNSRRDKDGRRADRGE